MKMKEALVALSLLVLASCGTQQIEKTESGLNPAKFQTELNGKKTDLYVLKNANGMEVCITNFGGRVVSVMVPDKDGLHSDMKWVLHRLLLPLGPAGPQSALLMAWIHHLLWCLAKGCDPLEILTIL